MAENTRIMSSHEISRIPKYAKKNNLISRIPKYAKNNQVPVIFLLASVAHAKS